MCRTGRVSRRRMVLARAVSRRISSTSARCHGPVGTGASVTGVALLEPWIAAVVVAVLLPEPGLVVVEQGQLGDPLGGLPEVQVGDQQAGGTAVVDRQRPAVDLPRDPGSPEGHIGEGQGPPVAPGGPGPRAAP